MQVSIAVVLNMLHINLVPFATAGGVGGIVLGFASQSVLANIVAGCNLLITRPLVVGDRVTLAGELPRGSDWTRLEGSRFVC